MAAPYLLRPQPLPRTKSNFSSNRHSEILSPMARSVSASIGAKNCFLIKVGKHDYLILCQVLYKIVFSSLNKS